MKKISWSTLARLLTVLVYREQNQPNGVGELLEKHQTSIKIFCSVLGGVAVVPIRVGFSLLLPDAIVIEKVHSLSVKMALHTRYGMQRCVWVKIMLVKVLPAVPQTLCGLCNSQLSKQVNIVHMAVRPLHSTHGFILD